VLKGQVGRLLILYCTWRILRWPPVVSSPSWTCFRHRKGVWGGNEIASAGWGGRYARGTGSDAATIVYWLQLIPALIRQVVLQRSARGGGCHRNWTPGRAPALNEWLFVRPGWRVKDWRAAGVAIRSTYRGWRR